MKIMFLGFTKIKYMPYLNFYLEQIDSSKHEIHITYWDRDENQDKVLDGNIVLHPFKCDMEDTLPLIKKLPKILQYGSFAKKTIKKVKPDFLIVMHSTTAFSILPALKREYKRKYIFDYRDMTYEGLRFYKKAICEIVENSALSFTSSDGFRVVLPETSKLLTSHNVPNNAKEFSSSFNTKTPNNSAPIRIACWGLLRHLDVNKAIIEALGSDKRFELHYYGRAQGKFLEYLNDASEKYNNVFFHGEYLPHERLEFATKTDIIHNVFDNFGTMQHAMSNKYYDGLIFKIPQICMKDSFMGKRCSESSIGFEVNPYNEGFADELYNLYMNMDENAMTANYEAELDRVMKQVEDGIQRINEVIDNAQK